MGNRALEHREADGDLFSDCFINNDADSLCHVLDGTQLERVFKLFWDFRFDFCCYVGGAIRDSEAKHQKNE